MPIRRPHRYWDSSVFLAWLKPERERRRQCKEILDAATLGKLQIVTSAITLTEVIKVKGERPLDPRQEAEITRFFKQPYILLVSVDRFVAEEARRLIWKYPNLHPKDSIHLATAILHKIEDVDTFDARHMVPLDGKIGSPVLRIATPALPQTSIPFADQGEFEEDPLEAEHAEEAKRKQRAEVENQGADDSEVN